MTDSTSNDTDSPKPRDPISIFLIGSAVVLGGMYLLEGRARSVDEDAHRLAQEYVAAAGLKCLAASAGSEGRTLSLSQCPRAFELKNIAWDQVPSEFAEVALTTDKTWSVCPRSSTANCQTGARTEAGAKEKPTH